LFLASKRNEQRVKIHPKQTKCRSSALFGSNAKSDPHSSFHLTPKSLIQTAPSASDLAARWINCRRSARTWPRSTATSPTISAPYRQNLNFLASFSVLFLHCFLICCCCCCYRNGFQKLEKIKDSNRQSRQLEELTEKMRECKRYFSHSIYVSFVKRVLMLLFIILLLELLCRIDASFLCKRACIMCHNFRICSIENS